MSIQKLIQLFEQSQHIFYYENSKNLWELTTSLATIKREPHVKAIHIKHKVIAEAAAADPSLPIWYKINPKVRDDYTVYFFLIYNEDVEYYLTASSKNTYRNKGWEDFEVNPSFQKSFKMEKVPSLKAIANQLKQIKKFGKPLTQQAAIRAITEGKILFESSAHTIVFTLFGTWYTTSLRRNKTYKFDNNTWRLAKNQGFIHKLRLIFTNSVQQIQ